jgi:hypothetical protein
MHQEMADWARQLEVCDDHFVVVYKTQRKVDDGAEEVVEEVMNQHLHGKDLVSHLVYGICSRKMAQEKVLESHSRLSVVKALEVYYCVYLQRLEMELSM